MTSVNLQRCLQTASNAVRIRMSTLKRKQSSKNLAEAAQQAKSQKEKGKHMISWSVCIWLGADRIYRRDEAENDFMWSFLMTTTTDEKDKGRISQIIGYMAENIHFWQKATRAETAAWSETYQGVTMNIYHLLLNLHSICCCLAIRQGCFVWALFLFCLRLNRHLVAIPDTQLLRIWSIKKIMWLYLNPKWCRGKKYSHWHHCHISIYF